MIELRTEASRECVVTMDAAGRVHWHRRDRAVLRELAPADALLVALLMDIDDLRRRVGRVETAP